jgi:hypothetical protein
MSRRSSCPSRVGGGSSFRLSRRGVPMSAPCCWVLRFVRIATRIVPRPILS